MAKVLILIYLAFTTLASSLAFKFNTPRILLPIFDDVRVNYTLSILEAGCFDFAISTGPELIQIQPIWDGSDCTHEVKVTAISRERVKKTASILATSKQTGEVLRCDVILDTISQLEVHTTTRRLYLEEAPEKFILNAKDSEGNDFSTLEGVEFKWMLGSQSRNTRDTDEHARQQVLRFLTFSESVYHNVPKEVEKFETLGKKGHMILLDGVNSGSARVMVKLPYHEYENVDQVEVNIDVIANLFIDPVRAAILVGDTIDFKVFQLKRGKLHEITIGDQYYLELNTKFASLSRGSATGVALGETDVILRDRNVMEKSEKNTMPSARLIVGEPDKITLNLLPYYNWVTVVGEKHDIAIDLFTKNDEKIVLGSKFKAESVFDAALFKESKRNLNGTRVHGQALQVGNNKVTGSFNELIANAEMLIYAKIELNPRLVILPYDVNKPAKQTIQFIASGGDGSFAFSTSNSNILTISSSGLADTHLERVKDIHYDTTGSAVHTTVKAAMSRNSKIFKTADVFFLPPVKLEIVGYNLETALNDHIDLHIGLFAYYNNAMVPFTACENLHFEVDFSNPIFKIVNMNSEQGVKASGACRVIRLKGISTGSTSVTVTYRHGDENLRDEAPLLVHDPLIVFNPESNTIVLPIGSSRNIIYQHGPRKSFNTGSELTRNFGFDKAIIDVNEVTAQYQDYRFGFNVLCKKIGDTQLRLEVFNDLNQKNVIKNSAVVITNVHCVKPRFINLLSLEKLKTACPFDGKSSVMHVRSMQETLDIEIEVLDQQKRKLQNISSLTIDLVFSQPNGAINHNIAFLQETETDEIDSVPVPRRDLVRTSIAEANLNHKIKATVKDYDHKVLKEMGVQPERPSFGIPKSSGSSEFVTPVIENELDYLAFDSALLPFTSISVFLAPGISEKIQLGQGSGHFDIKVKNPALLSVQHDKATSQLILLPKQIGETFVEIGDKCLTIETAKLHVSIVSVGRIELTSLDRVEIGKSIEARVTLYDSNSQLININFEKLPVYQLSEKIFNERTLLVALGEQNNLKRGEIRYIITGNELGETKVVVSSGAVSSTPVSIQVFQPLQLLPRNATILVGSSLEVSSRGGPKPNTNIVYSVENGDILAIDGSVVEGLKVGKTRVVGRSTGINPFDGSVQIFTEDAIFINVIPLSRIQIRTPLQRIKADNVMPVTLWAEPDVSPMVLGSLKNLRVRWQIESNDVLELKDVFEDLGVIYGEADAISMRARGLQAGKCKISASVYQAGQRFQASTEITVFSNLELVSPRKIAHDPIIVPPRTSLQLKVNLKESVFEVSEQAEKNVMTVSRDGSLKTFEMLGKGLVVATCNDQRLDIPVEVKNVHYIMTTARATGFVKGVQSRLPRALHLALGVTLHDNLGNQFSHSFEDIQWRLSSKNAVEVRAGENFTLSIGLLRESSNILAVSLLDAVGIRHAEDFVKLAVKAPEGIFAKKLLVTTGDIICFESPLTSGSWHSASSDVILHGPNVGRVLHPSALQKTSFVRHGEKSSVHMNFELDIRQPDRVQFRKSSDVFNGETYRGLFTISNHQQLDKEANLMANNKSLCVDLNENFAIDFVTCRLTSQDFGDVLKKFETSPVFDLASGSYACEIRTLTDLEDITSLSRSRTIVLQLEARLSSGISDQIDLRITPAVQITPRVITFNKIHDQEVTVTGMEGILSKLELVTSHPDNLSVVPLPKTIGNVQFGERKFKLRLHNAASVNSEMFIKVVSPLTQQTVHIPIVPQAQQEALEGGWFVRIMSNVGKLTALVVVVLTTIALILMCQRNRDLDTSGVFQNQRAAANQTLINNNNNKSASDVFTASPLRSQHNYSPSPRLSPYQQHSVHPAYGDLTIPSVRKKRTL